MSQMEEDLLLEENDIDLSDIAQEADLLRDEWEEWDEREANENEKMASKPIDRSEKASIKHPPIQYNPTPNKASNGQKTQPIDKKRRLRHKRVKKLNQKSANSSPAFKKTVQKQNCGNYGNDSKRNQQNERPINVYQLNFLMPPTQMPGNHAFNLRPAQFNRMDWINNQGNRYFYSRAVQFNRTNSWSMGSWR